ncbi:SpoIIE family protein phosphatase [Nibrella viscosa]|uniref:SpoIIE family protein phosphatase n=1 Tax=Nibrella viscosa TaxID=1084524 RepID=A0ABP8KPY5_9BACT
MAIKILSVDDELDMEMLIQQRFRRQIRDKRFEFVFAHNGTEALEKLSEDKGIDMILSDINMPGMDGLTFLSKINDLSNPLLKAVMVSAYGDMENIRTAMNRGAFDFITKPINFEDLEITINKTIEHIEMLVQLQKGRDQYIAIQKDLQIANGIQQSMLPKKFPAFPNRTDVDLHAFLEPAKTVGGDLFDFFLMDDGRLFFIVGDVSDKGIPAALFMAITKAIFKSHFANETCGDICDEVRQVNKFLCQDNSSFMFVTAFLGILNLKTGEIEYIDAGHEPPLILRKDGAVEVMKKKGGLALAIDDMFEYTSHTVMLNPGDALFLYTDGATDANNILGQRFGLERIQRLIAPLAIAGKPQEINDLFYKEVKEFIGDFAQFDDITVMTIRYNGPA